MRRRGAERERVRAADHADQLRAIERARLDAEAIEHENQRAILRQGDSRWVGLGGLIAVSGLSVWIGGFFYEISVESGGSSGGRIINTGLVSNREATVMTGGMLTILGVLMAGVGTLSIQLHNQTARVINLSRTNT